MRPWLSHSVAIAILTTMWLGLNQTLAPGHWMLGILIAALATRGYASLRLAPVPVRRLGVALELVLLVLADVVRSNRDVGRIVMRAHSRPPSAGFLEIALELRNPAGLATLACIITSTPGTAWAGYDSERGVLTMHVLDLIDDDAWIAMIRERYERRLLEIFP